MTAKTQHLEQLVCPSCEQGLLSPFHDRETFTYKGQSFTLENLEFSKCDTCGTQMVIPAQERRNSARVRDEFRKIDGYLTGEEIKAVRKRLNFTQIEASTLFGGGVNAFSKYERSEIVQSKAMDRLLRLLDTHPDALQSLLNFSREKVVVSVAQYETKYLIDLNTVKSQRLNIKDKGPGSKLINIRCDSTWHDLKEACG